MMVTAGDLEDLRREANLRYGGLWILCDFDAGDAPDPLGTGTGLASLRAWLQEPSDFQLEQAGTRFRATLHGRLA